MVAWALQTKCLCGGCARCVSRAPVLQRVQGRSCVSFAMHTATTMSRMLMVVVVVVVVMMMMMILMMMMIIKRLTAVVYHLPPSRTRTQASPTSN